MMVQDSHSQCPVLQVHSFEYETLTWQSHHCSPSSSDGKSDAQFTVLIVADLISVQEFHLQGDFTAVPNTKIVSYITDASKRNTCFTVSY